MNDDIEFTQLLPPMGRKAKMVDVVFGGDAHAVLNAGSMLFRNSNWTNTLLNVLDERQNDKSIPNIRGDHEQAILIHLYRTESSMRKHTLILPPRALNSYAFNFVWGDFVIHFAGHDKQKHSMMQEYAEQKENPPPA